MFLWKRKHLFLYKYKVFSRHSFFASICPFWRSLLSKHQSAKEWDTACRGEQHWYFKEIYFPSLINVLFGTATHCDSSSSLKFLLVIRWIEDLKTNKTIDKHNFQENLVNFTSMLGPISWKLTEIFQMLLKF